MLYFHVAFFALVGSNFSQGSSIPNLIPIMEDGVPSTARLGQKEVLFFLTRLKTHSKKVYLILSSTFLIASFQVCQCLPEAESKQITVEVPLFHLVAVELLNEGNLFR